MTLNFRCAMAAAALTLVVLLKPPTAVADETSLLSDRFDGSERVLPLLSEDGACYLDPDPWADKGIQEVLLSVSASGVYHLRDLAWFSWSYHGARVALYLYRGAYDSDKAPLPPGGQWGDEYPLTAGTAYTLVVQQRCAGAEDAWAVAVHGPGTVESDTLAELPALSRGTLSAADPTMTSDCGGLYGAWSWPPVNNAPYRQVGPVRVSRSGTYFHTALSAEPFDEIHTCLAVYTAPVDPADRLVHRVALLGTTNNTVYLEAGRDYWFVTHWGGDAYSGWRRYGRYVQVLAPPGAPRLNPGMAGSWYDPEWPGEGWFLTVFDAINQAFLAHFSFGEGAAGGDPPHRWTTAQGPFSGNHAELTVTRSEGGAFNASTPAPQQVAAGTVRLEFEDCMHGSIRYDPPVGASEPAAAPTRQPIVRLADDSVRLCETLYSGPGKLGPL